MDIFKGAYRMIDGICLRLQGLLVYRILACPLNPHFLAHLTRSLMMNSIKERSVRYSRKLFCISNKPATLDLKENDRPKGHDGHFALPTRPG